MTKFNNKQIIIVVCISLVVIITIGMYFYKTVVKDESVEYNLLEIEENSEINVTNNNDDEILNEMMIHVTGCVKNQGIVVLKEGSRIIDAIKAAGGETEEADLNKLNLAYELSDGEKLKVPSKNEEEEDSDDDEILVSNGGTDKSNNSEKKQEIININTANKEQLITLNGIGESTADKIIQYRKENGKFNNIEDIKNVPGIGDAKFENIKDKIKVK